MYENAPYPSCHVKGNLESLFSLIKSFDDFFISLTKSERQQEGRIPMKKNEYDRAYRL